jgi:hypothetical protein
VETLCLFSGLSNKKSRGSTQATTAATATATAATTPSKKQKINSQAANAQARFTGDACAVHLGLAD